VELSIIVKIVTITGARKITPVDENAKTFAALLRQKTFNDRDITFIKQLGFRVIVSSDTPAEL
jgi:hypothetical protein